MGLNFADLCPDYTRLWMAMKVDPANLSFFDAVARRRYASIARYKAIEAQTGVPATFIAVAHERESGGDFNTYLGNGERLDRPTRLVPKGRGPFLTFEAGAVDALEYQGLTDIKDWSLERILYELEAFNGWGYRLYKHINSPYLWARTSNYSKGKYVSDGVWDAGVEDRQLGCAGLISALWTIDPALRPLTPAAPQPDEHPAPLPPVIPDPAIPWPTPQDDPEAPSPPTGGFFVALAAWLKRLFTGA